jgi:hypothetical protein
MTYPGLVCLALCSLAVVALWIFLPFITADGREHQQIKVPHWVGVVGFAVLLGAILALRERPAANDQVARAVMLSSALIGGIALKWAFDLFARKPHALHERTLIKALLVAPLVPLVWGAVFAASVATPRLALVWFANGFFWQTIFGDFERMRERERVIVRRREPPLPAAPAG